MTPTLNLQTVQRQTFVLQQSMTLLRMSSQELTEHLLAAARDNPLLIVRPPRRRWLQNSATDTIEAMAAEAQPGLHAHVLPQLASLLDQGGRLHVVVMALIEELEPSGWLATPPDRIASRLNLPAEHLLAVLRVVQGRVEPTGLFACDLADCLRLQLEERGNTDPAMCAVLDHLPALKNGGVTALAAAAGVGVEKVCACLSILRGLDPKPGARFAQDPTLTRAPDARVVQRGEDWRVEFDRLAQPRVGIAALPRGHRDEAMSEALKQAHGLKHAIDLRQSATRKVITELVARQQAYFCRGPVGLVPLAMAELAEHTGFHASTVSRVLSGYLLEGPQGMIAARDLCSAPAGKGGEAPARASVIARIRGILAAENPARPVSDRLLADMLEAQGIAVSRRLVTKYRQQSGFASAPERRMFA